AWHPTTTIWKKRASLSSTTLRPARISTPTRRPWRCPGIVRPGPPIGARRRPRSASTSRSTAGSAARCPTSTSLAPPCPPPPSPRLLEPDSDIEEIDETSELVGLVDEDDSAGLSAEESAVHIVDEP